MKLFCWRARIEKKIKAHLKNTLEIKAYSKIDSTNSEAKRYAESALDTHPCLFIAREQSAGRGRVGRSFVSRKGRGIYMTLLYFADGQISDAVSVTTAAATAVAEAIEMVTGKPMRIKWVNDIYNERGKVSGILVEGLSTALGYAVAVGVGINIGKDDFPEEIRSVASSIGEIGGREGKMIAYIADALLDFATAPSRCEYMDSYRKRFMLEGKSVNLIRADEIVGTGVVLGVDDDGGLIVDIDGKREVIRSGEVTVRESEAVK